MKKYEYMVGVGRIHTDLLNEKGKDGWFYVERLDNDPHGNSVMLFGREVEEKSSFSERMAEAKASKKAKQEEAAE